MNTNSVAESRVQQSATLPSDVWKYSSSEEIESGTFEVHLKNMGEDGLKDLGRFIEAQLKAFTEDRKPLKEPRALSNFFDLLIYGTPTAYHDSINSEVPDAIKSALSDASATTPDDLRISLQVSSSEERLPSSMDGVPGVNCLTLDFEACQQIKSQKEFKATHLEAILCAHASDSETESSSEDESGSDRV